ncbi:MAG: T9SS type A sorting domain-containing protein [Bacteroidota bacterium]
MRKTKMLFALLVALAIAPFYSAQSCPGNYFSTGNFESFSSSAQLATAVAGSPMIKWSPSGSPYSPVLLSNTLGNTTKFVSLASCGQGSISSANGGWADEPIVLPMNCSVNPCDEGTISIDTKPLYTTWEPGTQVVLKVRLVQTNPLTACSGGVLNNCPAATTNYLDIDIDVSSPTWGAGWQTRVQNFVNTTPYTFNYALIWFTHAPAQYCFTQYLDNVVLNVTRTFDVSAIKLPTKMCKDQACATVVTGTSGQYTVTGPGVPDAPIYDLAGNETWIFCPTVAGAGTHTITICSGGCCITRQITVSSLNAPVITGNNYTVCQGNSALVCPTVPAGSSYTYLWNTGQTSQCINVTPPTLGTTNYTVTASNPGCSTTATNSVTAVSYPKIILPKSVSVCNGQFQSLCGPSNTSSYNFTYQWSYNNTVTQTSQLVSQNQCFVPTQYGNYTLIVTNQYGCSSVASIDVVQGYGPAITIANYNYCGHSPAYVGLPAAYSDALSYEWTYNGGAPFTGNYRIPYMGDGTYCLKVYWSNANVPSLLGCTSTVCFQVTRCCAANPEFQLTYNPFGSTATITVSNNPAYTVDYDSESFVLYKYCGPETDLDLITWTQIQIVTRSTNFNTPVVFSGLDENCIYKVVHRVTKNCLNKTYTSEQIAGQLKVAIYPNPAASDGRVVIELQGSATNATVEITDVSTGALVYQGTLELGVPLTLENRTALRTGVYNVKVYNNEDVVNNRLVVN